MSRASTDRPFATRALDTAMDRTLVLGYTRLGLRLRRRLPGWPADPQPGSMTGRNALVTGATSGLGIATVRGLARLGATVHMVVRDEAKADRVRTELLADVPGADLQILRCDVGDLDDVRRFAAELTVPRIDVLVHNAGVMPATRTESAQGHELSMAVHLLGPVLMTELLREQLRGGRVIMVSSGGMYAQSLPADDPEFRTGDYAPTAAYARSKRMQVDLAPRLADRWSLDGISLATMHPGWADTPGVQESLPTFRRVTRSLLRDADQGADTTVWLAATRPTPRSGRFWHDRVERPTHLAPGTRASVEELSRAWAWLSGLTLDV